MSKLIAALAFLIAAAANASAAAIHIVAFGDSATAGYLVPHDKAYPAQLQALLRKKGYDVAVANRGVISQVRVHRHNNHRNIVSMVRSTEGAVMRRYVGGIGCGACG